MPRTLLCGLVGRCVVGFRCGCVRTGRMRRQWNGKTDSEPGQPRRNHQGQVPAGFDLHSDDLPISPVPKPK
ncbi:hypothetical protein chiPu_0030598 [Chiloscyllium punctatum]|uniref:Uncharacterized protein n=1 Tax=Chiloscyllium punctatum TaxID=137246 RepID=A0A401TU80_CHIPU|nr:hypothetical protein [Chiloscyllium punctatum]